MPLTISAGYSSACSSSLATGMISLSTKPWTAARISCWTSLRPSVRASRAMAAGLPGCVPAPGRVRVMSKDGLSKGLLCYWRVSTRAGRLERAALGDRLELGRAGEPGGPALARDDQGHLAGGLVDHLVAEHGRALLAAGLGGAVVVRVEDQLGVVVVLLGRREQLVGDGDLVRVQHPLAVEAERRAAAG